MLPVDVTNTLAALFGPDAPNTLAPARFDPAILPLADTDRSGTLSREEIRAALQADSIRFDVATDRLMPATALSLTESQAPVATEGLTDAIAAGSVLPTVARSQPPLGLSAPEGPAAVARPKAPILIPPRSEPLMLVPHIGAMPAATVTNRGVDLTSPLTPSGTFRLGMHVDTDPTLAERRGTMLLEESHPHYLQWANVGGSGLNLGIDSRTRLEMAGLQPEQPSTGAGSATLAASVRHEQRIQLERSFSLFGTQPDTSIQAGYLMGIGPWQWPDTGNKALPLTQYATVAVTTRPNPYLGLSGELYVPVQDGPSGRGAHPIARVSATVPHLTVGTTQSADSARYDASLSVKPVPYLQIAATGAIDQNRSTHTTGFTAGMQVSVPW
jgi:hypothetical protein